MHDREVAIDRVEYTLFERQQILYLSYPYLLSKMKAHRKLVFNFVIAMSLITLLSLAEVRANESKAHFSNFRTRFENESSSLQLGWKSRRLLQERPSPRGFPPPDGNALVHNPRNRERTPPGRRPRVPDNPPPLKNPRVPDDRPPLKIPPPHP